MVERGQVLERMTLVRSGALELEGLFQSGGGRGQGMPVIAAPSHPRHGGTMDSAILGEIVWHLARRGHPTLRFNWRGVGASRGTSEVPWPPAVPSLDDEASDLAAAIDQHASGAACAVVGVSFGAAVAARIAARHPLVERLILVAPPVTALPFDFAALAASGTLVTIIAGSEDTTAPPAAIEERVRGLVGVQLIPGANHSFTRGLSELGRRVAASLPAVDAVDGNVSEE